MAKVVLTFLDAGVLIAAARASDPLRSLARAIILDPNRRFASSRFVQLEVLPKARFNGYMHDLMIYEEYFHNVALWADPTTDLIDDALDEASRWGMGAVDALHIVAASRLQVDEFITSEGLNKPIYRTRTVSVTTIHQTK